MIFQGSGAMFTESVRMVCFSFPACGSGSAKYNVFH